MESAISRHCYNHLTRCKEHIHAFITNCLKFNNLTDIQNCRIGNLDYVLLLLKCMFRETVRKYFVERSFSFYEELLLLDFFYISIFICSVLFRTSSDLIEQFLILFICVLFFILHTLSIIPVIQFSLSILCYFYLEIFLFFAVQFVVTVKLVIF